MRRALAALGASALALGCYVLSTHPIRGESPVRLDPALAGSWRAAGERDAEGDGEVFTFRSHGDHYVLAGGDEPEVYEVTTARLDGHRYLNAIEIGVGPSVFFVARYRIEGERLWIAPFDRDAVARYAARGELSVSGGEQGPAAPLVMTASTAELEHFLLSHDPLELFPEPSEHSVRLDRDE